MLRYIAEWFFPEGRHTWRALMKSIKAHTMDTTSSYSEL